MRRATLTFLIVVAVAAIPAPAALAMGVLSWSEGSAFNTVSQQVTIVRSPPSTLWTFESSWAAIPGTVGPGSWSIGLQTPGWAGRGRARRDYLSSLVFGEQGDSHTPCPKRRGTSRSRCAFPLPYRPGDTYELVYGWPGDVYAPVVHDATFNYDVFVPPSHLGGFLPPLGGLYDTARVVNRSGGCAVRGTSEPLAVVTTPLLDDYGLFGAAAGTYGEPPGQASLAGQSGVTGCGNGPSFQVAAAGPVTWTETETYRPIKRVRLVLGARYRRRHTTITALRVLGVRAPMELELDCLGGGCPPANTRAGYNRLGRLRRVMVGRSLRPGATLILFVGSSERCGPGCQWGSEYIALRVRSDRPLKLLQCNYLAGTEVRKEHSCSDHSGPRRRHR